MRGKVGLLESCRVAVHSLCEQFVVVTACNHSDVSLALVNLNNLRFFGVELAYSRFGGDRVAV
jgi:hypothetical protein